MFITHVKGISFFHCTPIDPLCSPNATNVSPLLSVKITANSHRNHEGSRFDPLNTESILLKLPDGWLAEEGRDHTMFP